MEIRNLNIIVAGYITRHFSCCDIKLIDKGNNVCDLILKDLSSKKCESVYTIWTGYFVQVGYNCISLDKNDCTEIVIK